MAMTRSSSWSVIEGGAGSSLWIRSSARSSSVVPPQTPGSTPLNDRWARRKSATTLAFHEASLLVGTRIRENGGSLEKNGLSPEDFSDHGGAVPIRVEGVGVVAAVTVSGLPQVEDHRLAVRAIEALLSGG